LIDLGLAKDLSAVRGHAGESLSIVDGKALGVGTPRYAAPEQMSGDAVSPATDVYALGMLANDCFGGKPPRAWRRIIQRATAAIPAQRYATVAAFTRAIQLLRARYWIRGTLVVVLAVSVLAFWTVSRKGDDSPLHVMPTTNPVTVSPTMETPSEKSAWQELCRNFTTNIVTRHTEMRRPDAAKRLSPAEFAMRANNPQYQSVLVSRAETNKIDATMVNLGGRTILFKEPIKLDAGREYWIVGPGVLDAQFSASSTATVRIANCIFRNRTKTSPGHAGIDYVLDGGAYLNFTDLSAARAMKVEAEERIRSNGMSEGRRWWRIKGPDDIAELVDGKPNSSNYSATMESF
jgi:serine/threonine protein kinase